jgi:hypothetical protein
MISPERGRDIERYLNTELTTEEVGLAMEVLGRRVTFIIDSYVFLSNDRADVQLTAEELETARYRKIEAIKMVRARLRLPLKMSLDLVDRALEEDRLSSGIRAQLYQNPKDPKEP